MAASGLCRVTWALLMLGATWGRPGTAIPAEEVPEPINLTVNSYNLNTTLHWDYSKTSITPYFYVEILDKSKIEWMGIETCQNISHHFCDLSYSITDSLIYYKVRVKALVGTKTSNPATIEFRLSSVGIIGPPMLSVSIEENIIVVDIFHPEVPSIHNIKSIMDPENINYIVYHGNDTKEATDCNEDGCTATFSLSDEKTYCFSAEVLYSDFLGIVKEKSKETCIYTEEENSKSLVGIIVGVVAGFLLILAIFCFIIARWTKARTLMPQSLSSVVRSIMSYPHMSNQQMPKYDTVSTSPMESPIDDITYKEEKGKTDTDGSTDSGSKESTDHGYQSSLTENELKTDEKEDDQFNSSSYFHTDSSSSGGTSTDPPESEKEEHISEHAPEPPKPLTDSFGYDKPHFPKELV